MHTYLFLLCHLREPRSNKTPVAMNALIAQILASNIILE